MDSDTLVILIVGGGTLVLQILDLCGVEMFGEKREAKGFEVVTKDEPGSNATGTGS